LGALQLRPEEQRVLRDDADFLAQAVQTDFRYVHAVDEGLARVDLVEPHQEMNEAALASAVGSSDGERFT
jgi:hypothetical protein